MSLAIKNTGTKIDMTVAETILQQLGGKRFVMMTGACALSATPSFLQMAIKAKNKAKCNGMKIELKADDTYTVTFWNVTTPKMNPKTGNITGGFKVLKEVDGIYCDMLQDVFTGFTGLYTRL